MRLRLCILFLLAALCTALIGASAHAATTVGVINFQASIETQLDELGQNIPIFQAATPAASSVYVTSSPVSGTVSSWSFLSAGADPGRTFALRVLRPTAAGQYLAVATSGAAAVTGVSGTSSVQGPFATSLPIQAGDVIALQAVDSDVVPILTGQQGLLGIRYFDHAFADGTAAPLSDASAANNGQVVPVQATVDPAGTAPAPVAPQNQSGPVITGTPTAGQTLTCDPGGWGGTAPISYSESWTVRKPVVRRIGNHLLVTYVDSPAGTGPTLAVADLPPVTTSFACTVTATNAAGSATATTASVSVQAVRPVIAQLFSFSRGFRALNPVATRASTTLRCTTGTWAHFPTRYTYTWFRLSHSKTGGYLRQRIPTPKTDPIVFITAKIRKYITNRSLECGVTAFNAAGYRIAYSSPV